MDKQNTKTKHIISVIALFIVALFWGLGFPALKATDSIPAFLINAIRFTIAGVLLVIIFPKKLKKIDKSTLILGLILGAFMCAAYSFATIGIKYTTSSRSSFFTAIQGLFVPFISWLIIKQKPKKKIWLCLALCLAGVYLITFAGSGDTLGLNKGDIISLGAAVTCATEIVLVDSFMKEKDVIALTIVEMWTIAVICGAVSLFTGAALPTGMTTKLWLILVFLGVFPSAICFVLKTSAQKNISATSAGLILTLEPPSGALFSMLLLHEDMGIFGYIGGVVVLLSIVISENDFKIKKRR